MTAGSDEFAVGGQRHRCHHVGGAGQLLELFAAGGVPQLHGVVVPAGSEHLAVGGHGDAARRSAGGECVWGLSAGGFHTSTLPSVEQVAITPFPRPRPVSAFVWAGIFLALDLAGEKLLVRFLRPHVQGAVLAADGENPLGLVEGNPGGRGKVLGGLPQLGDGGVDGCENGGLGLLGNGNGPDQPEQQE